MTSLTNEELSARLRVVLDRALCDSAQCALEFCIGHEHEDAQTEREDTTAVIEEAIRRLLRNAPEPQP